MTAMGTMLRHTICVTSGVVSSDCPFPWNLL